MEQEHIVHVMTVCCISNAKSSIKKCGANLHRYRSSYPWVAAAIIRGTHVLIQNTKLDSLINLTFPRFVRKVIDSVMRLHVIVLEFIFSLDIPQIEDVIFENLTGVP